MTTKFIYLRSSLVHYFSVKGNEVQHLNFTRSCKVRIILNTTSATVEKWEGQLQKDQVRRPANQNKTESFLDKTAGR